VGRFRSFLSDYEEPFRRSLLWIALYYMAGRKALNPSNIADADLWWHLRTGEWIIQHHWVPYTDSFSSYGMGRPWAAYSWLFEVLVYGLHKYFGLIGLLVFVCAMTLLITAALHDLIRTVEPRVANSIVLTGVAMFAMAPVFTPRPWLFTILFFTIELKILTNVRRSREYGLLFLLLPLFALWANLHIQFVYGLFVLGIFACENLISGILRRPQLDGDHDRGLPTALMTLVWIVCVLAALANPYHFRIYLVVLDTLRLAGLYNLISELAAMEFRTLTDWFVLALTLGAAFTLGRRGGLKPLWILLLLAGAFVSFRSRRDVWFEVIIAVAIICYASPPIMTGGRYLLSNAQVAFIGAAVGIVLLLTIRVQHISQNSLQCEVAKIFPVQAAKVVEERGYAGPLYNDFNWGGYLIWRLPQLPVAIDGRSNLHNAARIKQFAKSWGGIHDWASSPELNAARVVIAEKDAPLTQLLRLDARFELVYEDEVAVVFIAKNTPTN
jgi:hypothetical protein